MSIGTTVIELRKFNEEEVEYGQNAIIVRDSGNSVNFFDTQFSFDMFYALYS